MRTREDAILRVDAAIALFADHHVGRAALSEDGAPDAAFVKILGQNGQCQRGPPIIESERSFGPNQQIYGEGDPADSFFKIESGLVRTCKFYGDGRRHIDAFYLAGDLFGLETVAEHSFSAEAVRSCVVTSYPRNGIETLAATNPDLLHELFVYAMRCKSGAQAHSVLLGRGSALRRLAAFLCEVAPCSLDSSVVALAMPRQDVADYLGLTIETISRSLGRLERLALIELPNVHQIKLKSLTELRALYA